MHKKSEGIQNRTMDEIGKVKKLQFFVKRGLTNERGHGIICKLSAREQRKRKLLSVGGASCKLNNVKDKAPLDNLCKLFFDVQSKTANENS